VLPRVVGSLGSERACTLGLLRSVAGVIGGGGEGAINGAPGSKFGLPLQSRSVLFYMSNSKMKESSSLLFVVDTQRPSLFG